MNKIYFLNFVFILLSTTWAHGAVTEKAQLVFEPALSVCQKESSGFLECKATSNDLESELDIPLEKIGQINELEVWRGQHTQKISMDTHSAEFQVVVKMQQDLETNQKEYELIFQINDQVGGSSTSTVIIDNLEKLNFTKINLPEIKFDNKVYLISLRYGPATVSPYLIGDLAFDQIEAPDDDDLRASRPLKVDLWEDGVLPIVFKKGTSQRTIELIWSACKEWSTAANVKCIPGPYKNRQLVVSGKYLGADDGCWSMLGQSAYFLWLKRRMNIGKGCEHYSTVLHELGHAFGIGHEHQRMDRDSYIEILKENISDPYLGLNVKMNFSTQAGELLTPYDFLSIMHYSKNAFSKNGKQTLRPRLGYETYTDVMGKAGHLSSSDVLTIQKLYGLPLN